MQTVVLFVALAFCDPLVHLGKMDVPARLLLAAVTLGAYFVQLPVVPAVALEPADVVETSLVVDPCGQRFDAEIKGYDAIIAQGAHLSFFSLLVGLGLLAVLLHIVIHERTVVIPSCIPGHRHLMKVLRWCLREMCDNIREAFGSPPCTPSSRKHDGVPLDPVQVHRRIAEREELMA